MTEYQRAVADVDEIDRLVASLSGPSALATGADMRALLTLVDSVSSALRRMSARSTYGPTMRQRVADLDARWRGIEEPTRALLASYGCHSALPSDPSAASLATRGARGGSGAMPFGGSAAAAAVAATATAPLAPVLRPPPSAPAGSSASSTAARVDMMADLALVAHQAFLGLGLLHVDGDLQRASSGAAGQWAPRIVYEQPKPWPWPRPGLGAVAVGRGAAMRGEEGDAEVEEVSASLPPAIRIEARYVPLGKFLVLHTFLQGDEARGESCRANLNLGMSVSAVVAKVDCLLASPLLNRSRPPTLTALPSEVLCGLFCGLQMPSLAAVAAASRTLAAAVLDDDALWWAVAAGALSPQELEGLVQKSGGRGPAGAHRHPSAEESRQCLRASMLKRKRWARMPRRWPPSGRPMVFPDVPDPGFPPGFLPPIIGGEYDLFPGRRPQILAPWRIG